MNKASQLLFTLKYRPVVFSLFEGWQNLYVSSLPQQDELATPPLSSPFNIRGTSFMWRAERSPAAARSPPSCLPDIKGTSWSETMKLAPRCQLAFERQQQQQKQLLRNPGKTWPVLGTRTNKEELEEEEEQGGWRMGWWWRGGLQAVLTI